MLELNHESDDGDEYAGFPIRNERAVYIVSALESFTAGDDQTSPADRLETLEQFLSEIIPVLESAGIDSRRWFIAIFTSNFESSSGAQFSGQEILEDLRLCANTVNQQQESILECFRDTVQVSYQKNIPRAFDFVVEGRFHLPRSVKEVVAPFERTLPELERLMNDIFESHFASDPFELTQSILESTEYQFGSGLMLKGKTIIEALGVARCKQDFPEEQAERVHILKQEGYRPQDILKNFRKATLQKLLARENYTSLEVTSSLAHIDKMPLLELEAAGVECVRTIVFQKPELLADSHRNLAVFRDPAGNECTLVRMLTEISVRKWRELHPNQSELPTCEIISRKGYRFTDIIRGLEQTVRSANRAQSFTKMTDNEIRKYTDERKLTPLLDILVKLGNSPGMIIESLRLLEPEKCRDIALTDLVPRYVGLEVDVERTGGNGGPLLAGGNGLSSSFVAALLSLASASNGLQFSEEQFTIAKSLAIRSHRRNFEKDATGVIQEIAEHIKYLENEPQPALNASQRETILRLLRAVRQEFADILNEDLSHMETPPFQYQREGVRFLRTRDNSNALLADDAGLAKTYQAIAAAISCGYRTLYVCPASNVTNVKNEILEHTRLTEADIALITSESPAKRAKQIAALSTQQFTIISYETLGVLKLNYSNDFLRIQCDMDLVILDEAHTPENPDTQRGEAIRAIDIDRKWFLTATPYRNGITGMWWILNILDPESFPNEKLFIQQYCQTLGGLYELNAKLHDIMLRRTKEDTVEFFEDPAVCGLSFDEQLAGGQPRVPRQRIIEPEVEGGFVLDNEVEQTVLWMISDFSGWAQDYNERFAAFDEKINLDTINPLVKFQYIHKAIYQPESIGLKPHEALFREVDKIVSAAIEKKEKIILWVQTHRTADILGERYRHLGNLVLDGRTNPVQRIELINSIFQKGQDIPILIANEVALGTGVTITAAHRAAMVQPSWTPTQWIQTLGRHQRVIGLRNAQFAKLFADTCVLVPNFSAELVKSIDNSDLREVIEKGTLPAQTFRRIQGGKLIYQVVTEGFRDEKEFFREFQASLLKSIGLVEAKRFDLTSGMKPLEQSMLTVAQILAPYWIKARGNTELEEAVTQLVGQARFHGEAIEKVARVIVNANISDPAALRFISSVFEIKNRAVRLELLNQIPWVLRTFDEHKEEIAMLGEIDFEDGSTNILRLFPIIFRANHHQTSLLCNRLITEVADYGNSPEARMVKRQLLHGLVALLNYPQGIALISRSLSFESKLATGAEFSKLVYQVGHLSRLGDGLPARLSGNSIYNFMTLKDLSELCVRNAIEDFCQIKRGAISETLANDLLWNNSVDHVLALLSGWCGIESKSKREEVLAQAKEVFASIFQGEFEDFRKNGEFRRGKQISFLKDDKDFWDAHQQNARLEFESIDLNRQHIAQTLIEEYRVVKREIFCTGRTLEGAETEELFSGALRFDTLDLSRIAQSLKDDRTTVSARLDALAQASNPEVQHINDRYCFSIEATPAELAHVRARIDRAIGWLSIEEEFRSLRKDGKLQLIDRLRGEVLKKKLFYDTEGADHISFGLQRLADLVGEYKATYGKALVASVEESSHPAIISRMGALSPRMINCFNPDADPFFSQWVLGALGSKNFKIILVRDSNRPETILAWAPYKVRRSLGEDGGYRPNLFLERGLSALPYNFRSEILDLLEAKKQHLQEVTGKTVDVSHQIFGRIRRSDIKVAGTGSYTTDEYAEAVFHLRNSRSLIHMARRYDPVAFRADKDERIADGLGVGRKSLVSLLDSLRLMGATHVIDIRPPSKKPTYLRCSKVLIEAALSSTGIEYQYKGDVLGNPAGGDGAGVYSSYQEFMRLPVFQRQLAELANQINQMDGHAVILGSHAKQNSCTRGLLLHALFQKLAELDESA